MDATFLDHATLVIDEHGHRWAMLGGRHGFRHTHTGWQHGERHGHLHPVTDNATITLLNTWADTHLDDTAHTGIPRPTLIGAV